MALSSFLGNCRFLPFLPVSPLIYAETGVDFFLWDLNSLKEEPVSHGCLQLSQVMKGLVYNALCVVESEVCNQSSKLQGTVCKAGKGLC